MKVKKLHLDQTTYLQSGSTNRQFDSKNILSPLNRSLQQAAQRFNKSNYDNFTPAAHKKTNSFISQESNKNKSRYMANLNKHMQRLK